MRGMQIVYASVIRGVPHGRSTGFQPLFTPFQMSSPSEIIPNELPHVLPAADAGDLNSLLAANYGALRSLAERQLMADKARGLHQSLSPSSLLGEAFTKLLRQETNVHNDKHLAAIATMLFIRILTDRRRRRLALKRGGGARTHSLNAHAPESGDSAAEQMSPEEESLLNADVEFLHDRLAELAEQEPRRAEALSLHTIGGIPIATVASLLGVSVSTAERDIALARVWLATKLK